MSDPKAKDKVECLPFVRITVLGHSGSGKTCLVNSFVNNTCPARYTKTETAVVYRKKLEVTDDGEWEDIRRPVLVEIEDSPGSEIGFDDDMQEDRDEGGVPEIKKGARVTVLSDKKAVLAAFNQKEYRGKCRYRPAMDGMLGGEYPVRSHDKKTQITGLPSPDGSEGGVWNFPDAAVKLKVALDLPIDQFLTLDEKAKASFATLSEKKKHSLELQIPLQAYPRPVGADTVSKTLTRNRMGFFLCFDIADESCESLKEAMNVHKMLTQVLEKQKSNKLKPIIWLIGCKNDCTSKHNAIKLNRVSAQEWSDHNDIPFYVTAAKNHDRVTSTFTEMIQAICSRETLWSLDAADEGDEDHKDAGCFTN